MERISGFSTEEKIKTNLSSYSCTVTLRQIISDGFVVAEHLKKKFKSSKIILVGHSWGTIAASHMVQESRESFSNYVSVETVVDMPASDEMKYKFLEAN